MKHHPAAWIFIVAAALFSALPSLSCAEERFGPWVYYAPYYYPQNMKFAGLPLCPQDFAPKYESPNPPQPSNAVPPGSIGQQKPVTKVSSRGMHANMHGSGARGIDRPSLSKPYVPPSRPERVRELPSSTQIRHTEPTERSFDRPSPQEAPASTYLPSARPTPQLSTPGAGPSQYRPSSQPAVQPTPPAVPETSLPPVNRAPNRVETPELPSSSVSPSQRPSLYSAPVDSKRSEALADQSPQASASVGKKSWTWGRKPPASNQNMQRVPGYSDQNL